MIKHGKTIFHGIEFLLENGEVRFVRPHPKVKNQVEDYLNKRYGKN